MVFRRLTEEEIDQYFLVLKLNDAKFTYGRHQFTQKPFCLDTMKFLILNYAMRYQKLSFDSLIKILFAHVDFNRSINLTSEFNWGLRNVGFCNLLQSYMYIIKYSASSDLSIFHFPKKCWQIGSCWQIGWKLTNRVSGGFHSG